MNKLLLIVLLLLTGCTLEIDSRPSNSIPTAEVPPVLTVTETHKLSSYTTIYRIFDSERNQVCYVTESYVYGGYDSSINCP